MTGSEVLTRFFNHAFRVSLTTNSGGCDTLLRLGWFAELWRIDK